MCNLYKMREATAEVAKLFDAKVAHGQNYAEEVYPGYPGLVVADGEVQSMAWGFPLVLTSKQGQKLKPKSVNNARTDKLQSPFWRDSFTKRRCLIPLNAWAEAEGIKGHKTRTWYALADEPLFAVAGVWRPSAEWGNAYSMVMTDSCPQMAEAHDRMPVILRRDNWSTWTSGRLDEAIHLCRPWDGGLEVSRTAEPWAALRS